MGSLESRNAGKLAVGTISPALGSPSRRISSDTTRLDTPISNSAPLPVDSNLSISSAIEISTSAAARPVPLHQDWQRLSPVVPHPNSSIQDRTPTGKKLRRRSEIGLGFTLESELEGEDTKSNLGDAQKSAQEMMKRLGLGLVEDDLEVSSSAEVEAWGSRRSSASSQGSPPRVSAPTQLSAPTLSRNVSSSSLSSNSSFFSAISISPSINRSAPLLAGGFSMERTGSSTSSIHSRHASLTSACAPVTANSLSSNTFSGIGSGLFSPGNNVIAGSSGWNGSDWEDKSKENRVGDENDSRKGRTDSFLSTSVRNQLLGILDLPTNLLYLFLSPLNPSYSSHSSISLTTASSIKSSTTSKRFSLPLRLFTILYLTFSAIFLTFSLSKNVSYNPRILPRMKSIAPRGRTDLQFNRVGLSDGFRSGGIEFTDEILSSPFGLGSWVGKVTSGVRWSKKDEQAQILELVPVNKDISRIGAAAIKSKIPATNPLTPLTHTYRFAKMFDKISRDLHDEIEAFVFRASEIPNPHDTTACLYSNEAWISTLPEFVKVWKGPISLVFETSHSRHSPLRTTLIFTIESLRISDPLIRKHVDFHFVGVPNATSEKSLNRLREKLILRPVAQNFHFNLARFFAKTEIIFMVGDARILPSPGLFDKLQKQDMKELILERGDALVVPTFGFVRDRTGGVATLPNLAVTRKAIGLRPVIERAGVSEREFEVLAKGNVDAHFDSLPIPTSRWPTKKSTIVSLVSTKPGTLVIPSSATLALFDESWDLNRGPTNWYLWRKSISDPRLADSPSVGGGLGLGLNETIGGGANVYKIIDYDLHYSPALVMSNKGQPWCTERFETLKSACVYQIYLTGTELWVLPEEWIFTLEPIEKIDDKVVEDPGLALKNAISARLFNKFHQEACMHFGREFLSLQMWNSEKAQHLRSTCAKVLTSWGMGL